MKSTVIDQFPGDVTGDSIIVTATGSAEKGETSQLFYSDGLISNPASGTVGFRISKGSLDIVVGSMNYQIPIPENPGEKLLYSTDADGVIQCKLFLDAEGNFIFNDGSDFAVRYSALETAYNQLKTDFASLVTVVNDNAALQGTHSHAVTVDPGTHQGTAAATSTPGDTGSNSTGDITPSKIEEIKVP
jgi:hypothetical protein